MMSGLGGYKKKKADLAQNEHKEENGDASASGPNDDAKILSEDLQCACALQQDEVSKT